MQFVDAALRSLAHIRRTIGHRRAVRFRIFRRARIVAVARALPDTVPAE
jgi:hypothetical protein